MAETSLRQPGVLRDVAARSRGRPRPPLFVRMVSSTLIFLGAAAASVELVYATWMVVREDRPDVDPGVLPLLVVGITSLAVLFAATGIAIRRSSSRAQVLSIVTCVVLGAEAALAIADGRRIGLAAFLGSLGVAGVVAAFVSRRAPRDECPVCRRAYE